MSRIPLQSGSDSPAPPDGAGIRVLSAEDEAALAEGLAKALSAFGFAVRVVSDGGAVRPALAAGVVDVLVLDLGLPVMDGRAVLRALRAADVRIPVLVLTARDALACGAYRDRARHGLSDRSHVVDAVNHIIDEHNNS